MSSESTNAQESIASGSLDQAKEEAQQVVEEVLSAVGLENQGVFAGREEQECDPQELGGLDFAYEVQVEVPRDEAADLAASVWAEFERRGFVSNTGTPYTLVGYDNRGTRNGFRAVATGDPTDRTLRVGVVTPCLQP
jgi:hypothetical protein